MKEFQDFARLMNKTAKRMRQLERENARLERVVARAEQGLQANAKIKKYRATAKDCAVWLERMLAGDPHYKAEDVIPALRAMAADEMPVEQWRMNQQKEIYD